MKTSYWRFAAMIATSTVVMFALMYVHTYVWEDVYFSETRAWMALLMGATMTIVMLGFMWAMYTNRAMNLAIILGAALALALSTWLIRSQVTVDDTDYMTAMVPHHSIAILTSARARIEDPRVRKLADEIVAAQRKEIAEMTYLIRVLRREGVKQGRPSTPPAEAMPAADAVRTAELGSTDLEPITDAELKRVFGASAICRFSYAAGEAPVAVAAATSGDAGGGLIKLHGRLVPMTVQYSAVQGRGFELSSADVKVVTTAQGPAPAGGPHDAESILTIGTDLEVGYGGFYECSKS